MYRLKFDNLGQDKGVGLSILMTRWTINQIMLRNLRTIFRCVIRAAMSQGKGLGC